MNEYIIDINYKAICSHFIIITGCLLFFCSGWNEKHRRNSICYILKRVKCERLTLKPNEQECEWEWLCGEKDIHTKQQQSHVDAVCMQMVCFPSRFYVFISASHFSLLQFRILRFYHLSKSFCLYERTNIVPKWLRIVLHPIRAVINEWAKP